MSTTEQTKALFGEAGYESMRLFARLVFNVDLAAWPVLPEDQRNRYREAAEIIVEQSPENLGRKGAPLADRTMRLVSMWYDLDQEEALDVAIHGETPEDIERRALAESFVQAIDRFYAELYYLGRIEMSLIPLKVRPTLKSV